MGGSRGTRGREFVALTLPSHSSALHASSDPALTDIRVPDPSPDFSAAPSQSSTPRSPASPAPPPHRFGWHRVTHTLLVLGVAGGCALVLFLVGQRLPAFASITRTATYLVGAVALIYVVKTWLPRKGQRRHGERRHDDDRRAEG